MRDLAAQERAQRAQVVGDLGPGDRPLPEQVAPAQRDAIKAREDRDRFQQEALAYSNDILPRAQGQAARRIQEAQAYRIQLIAEAEGDTARFGQLLSAYERAPNVTRERLYLEAVESVLGRSRKVLIDTKGDNMLYVPLDKLLEKDREARFRNSDEVLGYLLRKFDSVA